MANRTARSRRKAVYAGSFDPITNGHLYMIRAGAQLFDELVVALGINPDKHYTFSFEARVEFLRKCTGGIANVTLDHFSNMFLVDYAKKIGAGYILRGIRNPADYEFERGMRFINADLNPNVITTFLMPPREISEVSSSFVKGLVGPLGWEKLVRQYIPAPIYQDFIRRVPHGHTSLKGDHGGLKEMPERG